jgi:hypothetical protein
MNKFLRDLDVDHHWWRGFWCGFGLAAILAGCLTLNSVA